MFPLDLQVGHLQCSYVQEEIAYDKAVLSHHCDYCFRDSPIHIQSSEISSNQVARRVE
jgi:hypothetical protein